MSNIEVYKNTLKEKCPGISDSELAKLVAKKTIDEAKKEAAKAANGKTNKDTIDWHSKVMYALDSLGITANIDLTWRSPDSPISTSKEVLERVTSYFSTNEKIQVPSTYILNSMTSISQNIKDSEYVKFRSAVSFRETATDTSVELAKIITGKRIVDHELEIDALAIRQIIYQIKKRSNSLPPSLPIMLNFKGNPSCGKSEFVSRHFLSALPSSLIIARNSIAEAINDERNYHLFSDHLCVIFNEKSNSDKLNVESLKNLLDQPYVTYRMLGMNKTEKSRNISTIISTSNKPINETINDEVVRKYYEICFGNWNASDGNCEYRKLVESFDFINLWQSVDESKEDPLLARHDEFIKEATKRCGSKSAFTLWFDGFLEMNAGKQVQSSYSFAHYTEEVPDYRLSQRKWVLEMEKRGCQRKHISSGAVFILPRSASGDTI